MGLPGKGRRVRVTREDTPDQTEPIEVPTPDVAPEPTPSEPREPVRVGGDD